MPLPIIDINQSDNDQIENLLKTGACLIAIPNEIENNLQTITRTSNEYFAQPFEIKKQELKLPTTLQGYINQSELGYDIERFISHGFEPIDPFMKGIQAQLNQTRNYLREDILKPLLFNILSYLNIDEQKYKPFFEDFNNTLSIIHYPAQGHQDDRLPAHNDAALMTALWAPQPGLDILVDGEWHAFTTPPGYVIVQLGDGLQLWTNNQTNPLTHRVQVIPNVARTAIASFCTLPMDAPFNCLVDDSVITNTFGEFIREHLKETYKPR